MRLAWTKSKLPLSVAIRWGLNEPVSHFVIVFNDCLLFQSNLLGTGLDYYPYFIKNEAEVVYEIEVPLPKEVEDKIYDTTMMSFGHKYYDWGAFFFFMWRIFLKKFFRIPLPSRNLWSDGGTFLCVGLIKCLDVDGVPDDLRKAIRAIPDVEMISPYGLYTELLKVKLV